MGGRGGRGGVVVLVVVGPGADDVCLIIQHRGACTELA